MKKKAMALVLALVMVLSLLPVTAMATTQQGATQQIFWGFEEITSVDQMEIGKNYIFFTEAYDTNVVVTGLPEGSAILNYGGTDYTQTDNFVISPFIMDEYSYLQEVSVDEATWDAYMSEERLDYDEMRDYVEAMLQSELERVPTKEEVDAVLWYEFGYYIYYLFYAEDDVDYEIEEVFMSFTSLADYNAWAENYSSDAVQFQSLEEVFDYINSVQCPSSDDIKAKYGKATWEENVDAYLIDLAQDYHKNELLEGFGEDGYCNQDDRDGYVTVMQAGPGFDTCYYGTIAYIDYEDSYDGEAWYYGCNWGGVYYVGPFYAYTYNEGEFKADDISAFYKPGKEPTAATTVTLDDIDVTVNVNGASVSVGEGFVEFIDATVDPTQNDNAITLSVGGIEKTIGEIGAPPATYNVTVNNGSGDGSFAAGRMVVITADAPADGMMFDKWTGNVTFADATASTTSFVMPEGNVTVTATYRTEGTDSSDDTYTIALDRTNYADGYLELYAYDKDNHNVGDPISENNATVSMPEDGFVRVFAGKEFTVTAEGATVSDMLEAGEEGYYYQITDFTDDTTVVVSEKVGPTYEITLDGSDFSGWYLLLNAYDSAGGRVGRIDEDGASISMPQDGFVEVLTSHECIVTAEGATVVALPHAEEAEVYGYKITNFTKDTTVVVSDIPDIIVDTIDLTVDWDKVPELVVGKPGPAFRPSNPDGGDYLVVNCDGVSEYFYGWLRERTEEEGTSGTKWIGLSPNDVIADDVAYALGVEFPLNAGYVFADTVTVTINGGLVATIDYMDRDINMIGITIALGKLEDIEDAKHSHEMTKTDAEAPTCTDDGNIEYYTCSGCGKFFADAEGKTELAADKLVVKSEGHKMTKTDAKAATCTADGNVEYYTCSVCEKHFADAEGKTELAADKLAVKFTGHEMTKTAAKAATCTADGNIEYYTCSVCEKHFADAEGKTELAADKLAVKSEGHKIEKIAGKAPTYIADGNKEYYHCNVCDTAFADAEGKTELTASEIKDLVIPQLILVAENKAEVSEGAMDKALSESKKDEDVTLDLTHKEVVGEENVDAVTKVELPVAALETMVEEKKSLTLVKEDATVTLDAKALETVVEQAEGNTVTLVVKNVETTTLKPAQQAAVESKKVAATISAELICDQTGEKIATKDDKGFGGGAVTVAIPVPEELPAGIKASDLKVYYVADDGTVEHLSSKLEGDKIVFTLKHFSEYVIAADAPADPMTPPTGDNSAVAMCIMLAVISAAAIVLLIAYEKNGKRAAFKN